MGGHRGPVGLGALALVLATLPIATPAAGSGADNDTTLIVSGQLETVVADDFARHRARTETTLLLRDGSRLDVRRTPGLPESGRVTATVDVAGAGSGHLTTRSSEGLALARTLDGSVTLHELRLDAGTVPQATSVAHRAHVVVIRNLGDWGTVDDEQIRARVSAALTFWRTEAGSRMPSFEIAGFEDADSSHGCGVAGSGEFRDVVDEAAQTFPSVDFSAPGEHLVVLVPDECQGSFLGRGTLGTSLSSGGTTVSVAEGPGGLATIAHELGHNTGLMHANARACSPFNPLSCSFFEYGDLYEVMGFGSSTGHTLPALGSAHRAELGLLGPAESQVLRLPDTETSVTSTVTLAPRSAPDGLRSLELVDPETGRRYFGDARSGTGRDAGTWYLSGYRLAGNIGYGSGVVVTTSEQDKSTTLLPRTVSASDHPAAWQSGETFTNDTGTVSVRVDAIGPSGAATVTATLATDAVPFPDPPEPSVEGVAEVGETLRLDLGGWPEDAFVSTRWYVDGVAAPYDAEDPSPTSFYLRPEHRGATIEVEVTTTREGNRALVQRSAPLGPVRRSINGFVDIWAYPLQVGKPVNSSISTYPENATRTLQWLLDGTPVTGATGSSYTPVAADGGHELRLEVTASSPGYDDTVLVSDTLLVPEAPPPLEPGSPTVVGTPAVGSRLTADPGDWPSGTAWSYQWFRGEDEIPNATAASYTPALQDLTEQVAVEVRGELDGQTASATSPRVIIGLGTLTAGTPTVSGRPKVGKTLRADAHRWTAGTTLRFQWLANGTAIRRATGATLRLTQAHRGKRISVQVTGTKPGYTPATRTSARTAAVRR